MKETIISIDRAGRIVLPKALRDMFDLRPGHQLQVDVEGDHLKLRPTNVTPALVLRDGLWVHQGAAQSPLNTAVEQHRESRLDDLKRGKFRSRKSK